MVLCQTGAMVEKLKKKRKAPPAEEVDEATKPGKATGDKSEHKSKTDDAEPPKLSDDKRRQLAERAIAAITEGLKQQVAHTNGRRLDNLPPFIPEDWASVYKPHLGAYKHFLSFHRDKFVIVEKEQPGQFFLMLREFSEELDSPAEGAWRKKLSNAWHEYCKVYPRDQRDFNVFAQGLPPSAMLYKLHGRSPGAVLPEQVLGRQLNRDTEDEEKLTEARSAGKRRRRAASG